MILLWRFRQTASRRLRNARPSRQASALAHLRIQTPVLQVWALPVNGGGLAERPSTAVYLRGLHGETEASVRHEPEKFILPKSSDLDRSRHIGRVVEHLESLEMGHAWRVTVEELKSERSLKQNAYLFGVAYALISEATGYEKDDLHSSLLGKHFGTKLKRVPKSKYNEVGLIEVPVRTTTTDENGRRSVLGKMQFAEYVAFVQRFAADKLGVFIPDPDPDYALHEQEQAA